MPKRITLLLSCLIILVFSLSAFSQQPAAGQEILVEDVEFRGNRRIPKDTLQYSIQTKKDDRYNPDQIRRDFESILNLGFFDPLRSRVLEADGPKGGKIVIFEVKEYPIIRDLQYRGMKSVTESEMFTKFKERRVSVTKETQFDPGKINGARLVLREALAEKGHPDAKVDIEIEEINQTSIALIFNVDEGPRVRIKDIIFTGTDKFSQRRLKGAMKVVKESGLISSFQSKDIYFKPKLEYDLENVRQFLGSKGYLNARIGEPEVKRIEKAVSGFPIISRKGPGLVITVPIEVGRRYKIKSVKEEGVTLFQPGVVALVSGLRVGEYANAETIRKNIYEKDGIKSLYGDRGYINASAELEPEFTDVNEQEGEVAFTVRVEEGKQYTLRRLEFIGNSNTRDNVMRREIAINEGDPYSKRAWDISILRLNQLGLFEEIKEKDAITRTNDRDQTVDVDLQVKERGRQSINLSGGVSGLYGSFFGLSYSTNNLLGYGETLEISLNGGNRQQLINVGFTEPYFLGKNISMSVNLFMSKYQFVGNGFYFNNAALLQSSLFGLSSLDADTLFSQSTAGGTINFSAPFFVFGAKRFPKISRFGRVGLSYTLSTNKTEDPKVNTDADPKNDIPVTFSQPKILTSRISPYFSYDTRNSFLDPTRGMSILANLQLSGGVLGGDVNVFSPTLDFKYFIPVLRRNTEKPHVIGMRFLGQHAMAFGKRFDANSLAFVGGVPIYERFFLGGEYDIRGYNIRSISPVARIESFLSTRNVRAQIVDPNDSTKYIDAPAGYLSPNVLRQFTYESPNGNCTETPSANCNVVKNPAYANGFFTPIGGDTSLVYNLEYRVPIFSALSVAAFADVGTVFNLRKFKADQLSVSNFLDQPIADGVLLNPAGRVATAEELAQAQIPGGATPPGFRTVRLLGESRSYDVVRLTQNADKIFSDVRASLGAEIRVQVPMLNVPFRLIFAYNPNARTDPFDPKTLYLERRTAIRFAVGRTF
ncbi:MAG TPA: outer membrane protein assembly factor BamA [Blastocatellia bacterium]|nr:outer membrane protein assembly factor BamA [Blastocatellia bacterium]